MKRCLLILLVFLLLVGCGPSFEPPTELKMPGLDALQGVPTVWVNGRRLEQVAAKDGVLTVSRAELDGGDGWLPVSDLKTEYGYSELVDPEENQVFYTTLPDASAVPAGVRIPVFRCHAVSDDIWGYETLFLSPSTMERLIQIVLEQGCTPITFEDLPRVNEIEKPVMFTFDDGYRDNYEELFPLLQKYQVKATIFMITSHVGLDKYLTAEQIREMQASGLVSFQSHTQTHAGVSELDGEALEQELGGSALDLARLTGVQPFVFSYPQAKTTEQAAWYVAQYYRFSVYRDGETYVTGEDPYAIPRYIMPRELTEETFLGYLE